MTVTEFDPRRLDMKGRLETLETLCATMRGEIESLRGRVAELEEVATRPGAPNPVTRLAARRRAAVLEYLANVPGWTTPSAVGPNLPDDLGITDGNAAAILKRLAADGSVERLERDGRKALYRITPKGEAQIRPVPES